MPKAKMTSLDDLSAAAARGDPAALEKLALTYLEGWGVERDYAKARDLYERAARGNDPGGHFGLAVMFAHGWGVRADPVGAYMHLVLMKRRGDVLRGRWNQDTARRMLETADNLAGRLSASERARAERLADDWTRRHGGA